MLRIDFFSVYLQHTCDMARHPLFWNMTGSRGARAALGRERKFRLRGQISRKPTFVVLAGSPCLATPQNR